MWPKQEKKQQPTTTCLRLLLSKFAPTITDTHATVVAGFIFTILKGVLFIPQVLLDRVVAKTEGYEVRQLEKLYALLCQSIYRHRRDYNKTALIQVGTPLY